MRKRYITIFFIIASLHVYGKSFEYKVHDIDTEYRDGTYASKWYRGKSLEQESINRLIKVLELSKSGKAILKLARRKAYKDNKELLEIIIAGERSMTDTSLVRRFGPSTPHIVRYIHRSKVYINKSLSFSDAVLDLAHELTHYTFRKTFNPYEIELNSTSFIKGIIEGKGGEVDAYIIECRVYDEIFRNRINGHSYCHKVKDSKGLYSRQLVVHSFYRVGDQYSEFVSKVPMDGFGHLSNRDPFFISSVYDRPYPLAALDEFLRVKKSVCINEKKRLSYMYHAEVGKSGRMPSSSSFFSLKETIENNCSDLDL